MRFMSEVDPYTVVKWIFIVLAAGFVGQFGKTFAQYLMRRTREKAAGQRAPAEKAVSASLEQRSVHPGKMGEGKEMQTPVQGASNAVSDIPDEKAEKKAAKARKKEIKLLKKMFK
jgi:hypothetical protein